MQHTSDNYHPTPVTLKAGQKLILRNPRIHVPQISDRVKRDEIGEDLSLRQKTFWKREKTLNESHFTVEKFRGELRGSGHARFDGSRCVVICAAVDLLVVVDQHWVDELGRQWGAQVLHLRLARDAGEPILWSEGLGLYPMDTGYEIRARDGLKRDRLRTEDFVVGGVRNTGVYRDEVAIRNFYIREDVEDADERSYVLVALQAEVERFRTQWAVDASATHHRPSPSRSNSKTSFERAMEAADRLTPSTDVKVAPPKAVPLAPRAAKKPSLADLKAREKAKEAEAEASASIVNQAAGQLASRLASLNNLPRALPAPSVAEDCVEATVKGEPLAPPEPKYQIIPHRI